ncbi:hypothetical protein K3175_10230 [Qipengyuania sp. GH1]|uniref:hypothetical protein n=1 Tax=Qipengyuania aestuarii TaxID=2867241 RepID=UPI001C873F53|nr:hypothetical protein [Qipengyuania aestuarii]MBX7536037.1 hypothetical protein [Qipengyuania aestuarii]
MKIGKILLLSAAIFTISAGLLIVGLSWALSEFFFSNCQSLASGVSVETCNEIASYKLDQGALFAAVFGISVSSVSAIALIVTIYFTSRATEAAVRAADSAERSIEISREIVTIQLRPYVVGHDINLVWSPNDCGEVQARYLQIVWENVGETPAINVLATVNFTIIEGELPEDFHFPGREKNNSAGSIGKSKSVTSSTALIDLDQMQKVLEGDKILHLWGYVEYSGTNSSKRYRTELYSTVNFWNAKSVYDINLKHGSTIKEVFNGMDDYCSFPIN